MEKAPTLKELLSNRKENHANLIIVSRYFSSRTEKCM